MNKKQAATEVPSQNTHTSRAGVTLRTQDLVSFIHNLDLNEGGDVQWRWQFLVCLNVMVRKSFNCLAFVYTGEGKYP